MGLKIFVSGPPGAGKTTLIVSLARRIKTLQGIGFYTEEIRGKGMRMGFRLVSLTEGKTAVLAHVDIKGAHRIGRYGVDIEGFERFIDGIPFDNAPMVIIDEIGKMECMSRRFRNIVSKLLESNITLLATIAKKGTPYIEGIKRTSGIKLFDLAVDNREEVLEELNFMLSR